MMRMVVDIDEAKASFPELVKQAEAGDGVIVTRLDKQVAKRVAYVPSNIARNPGLPTGRMTIKPGFDELPPSFDAFP